MFREPDRFAKTDFDAPPFLGGNKIPDLNNSQIAIY
jgi:hypothetical protein